MEGKGFKQLPCFRINRKSIRNHTYCSLRSNIKLDKEALVCLMVDFEGETKFIINWFLKLITIWEPFSAVSADL